MIVLTEIKKVALVGKMRSGKDTVANRLFSFYDFEFPIAFATKMKLAAHDMFPWIPKDPKPRELYQFMDVMKQYDPHIWIKNLERSYEFLANQRSVKGIVISDVRSQDEATWCRENGFLLVKIEADDETRKARLKDEYNEGEFYHKTELSVDDIVPDYTIVNNGKYEELADEVSNLVTYLNER